MPGLFSTNADSVKSDLPGVTGISGSIEIIPQESGTYTYTFIAYGKGNRTTTKDVTFSAILPTEDEALLCFGTQQFTKLEFPDTLNNSWVEAELLECLKDDLLTFYFPIKSCIYDKGQIGCYPEEPQYAQGVWSLAGDTLTIDDTKCQITILTEDTLILTRLGFFNLKPQERQTAQRAMVLLLFGLM